VKNGKIANKIRSKQEVLKRDGVKLVLVVKITFKILLF
jgi:hypothetical protein